MASSPPRISIKLTMLLKSPNPTRGGKHLRHYATYIAPKFYGNPLAMDVSAVSAVVSRTHNYLAMTAVKCLHSAASFYSLR